MSSFLLRACKTEQRSHFLKSLLGQHGLDSWWELAEQRWQDPKHGDTEHWSEAVRAMPQQMTQHFRLDTPCIKVGDAAELNEEELRTLHNSLKALTPWRKGPWRFFDIDLDAEWRSDMKWERIQPHLSNLEGRRILDVGCNNGYFLLRMLGAKAQFALGVEPAWLSHWQFAAMTGAMMAEIPVWMIPARLEELPPRPFDSVFSMGALHHQHQPEQHLKELYAYLEPGGELVLESLVVEKVSGGQLRIPERYASMRNVHVLLTPQRIQEQLEAAGFEDIRFVDCAATTVEEQRRTEWMPYHSLEEALDPKNPEQTIEGHPAPLRGIFIARKPDSL